MRHYVLQNLDFSEEALVEHVHADFCIRSDILDPAKITAELGIQPSRAWAKGEKYSGKALDTETGEIVQRWSQHPWGIWGIDSKEKVNSKRVEQHALYLLDLLEPKKSNLRYYLERERDYQARFYIRWEPGPAHGSYHISSETLGRMAALCHYVEFSYIFTETDEAM